MQSPWEIDDGDIPDSAGVNDGSQQTKFVGFLLWGLFIGTTTLVFVTDPEKISAEHAVAVASLVVTTAVVSIVAGWIVSKLLKYIGLFGFGGQLLTAILLFIILVVVLPQVVPLLLDRMNLLGNLPLDTDLPLPEIAKLVELPTSPTE